MDLKKPLTLRSRIKNITVDVVLSSTSHGLPNILKSTKLSLKLMWAFFTALSTGLCAYLITESVIKYFNYEVTTKTRILSEYSPYFPTITICNTNYFTSDFSVEFIAKLNNNSISANPFMGVLELVAKTQANQPEFENLKKNFGDSKEKLFVYCQYVRPICNLSELTYFLHPNYGNCYQFNTGYDQNKKIIELEKSLIADRLYGLKLILNISVPDSLKPLNPSLGALIFIHNHTTYPLMVDPVAVSPQTETNIAISRNFFKSQKKPYSNCDGNTDKIEHYDSEYYKLVHKNVKEYSQAMCVSQCFQKLFIDKCECYVANYPSFYQSKPCNLAGSADCVDQVFKILHTGEYLTKECLKKCPLECEGMRFDRLVSTTKFSNEEFDKFVSEYNGYDAVYFNKTFDSQHLAAVNIYYNNLGYTLITENPTTDVVTLFSSIGGVAGLFLGISVLTLVEIIEIMMQIIYVFAERKKINVKTNF